MYPYGYLIEAFKEPLKEPQSPILIIKGPTLFNLDLGASVPKPKWEFPKIRGTLFGGPRVPSRVPLRVPSGIYKGLGFRVPMFGGPYNKDPAI